MMGGNGPNDKTLSKLWTKMFLVTSETTLTVFYFFLNFDLLLCFDRSLKSAEKGLLQQGIEPGEVILVSWLVDSMESCSLCFGHIEQKFTIHSLFLPILYQILKNHSKFELWSIL